MIRLANRVSLLALILGWLAATTIVVALLVDARSAAFDRGERAAAALTQVMEQHTARTIQSAALTVRAVADAWTLSRPHGNEPAFQALLRQRLNDLPYARALFVIGPDGYLIHDTDYPRTPAVNLADRAYFMAFRDNRELESDVSGPYLSRSGGGAGWFVSVATRLGAPGDFHGVVVAALPAAYFEALYDKMALSGGEEIALFHRDGTLIARHPTGPEDIGRSFKRLPLFAGSAGASGSYRVDGHLVAGKRIVSYRSVEGLPLVVHVSLSERALLAEWRRSAASAAVAMAALTLLLAGMLVQLVRRRNRLEQMRAQRAQAEKLEALGQVTGGIAHAERQAADDADGKRVRSERGRDEIEAGQATHQQVHGYPRIREVQDPQDGAPARRERRPERHACAVQARSHQAKQRGTRAPLHAVEDNQ